MPQIEDALGRLRTGEYRLIEAEDRQVVFCVSTSAVVELDALGRDLLTAFKEPADAESISRSLEAKYDAQEISHGMRSLRDAGALLPSEELNTSCGMSKHQFVSSIAMHVCHSCNMSCVYCYGKGVSGGGTYGGPREFMSEATAKSAVDFLLRECLQAEGAYSRIIFFGGEPLLNFPIVRATVLYAKQAYQRVGKRLELSMTTNGTLLTDDVIRFLNKEWIGVQVSMDGDAPLQDRLRPLAVHGQGSYEMVKARVRRLVLSRRRTGVAARATVTSLSLDLVRIERALREIGFRRVYMAPGATPLSCEFALQVSDYERLKDEYQRLADDFVERITSGEGTSQSAFGEVIQRVIAGGRRTHFCGGGLSYLSVAPDGNLYFCHRFAGDQRYRMGDVFRGVSPIAQERVMDRDVDAKDGCRNCWVRYVCGGGCEQMHDLYEQECKADVIERMCDLEKFLAELALRTFLRLPESIVEEIRKRASISREKKGTEHEFRPYAEGDLIEMPTSTGGAKHEPSCRGCTDIRGETAAI